MARIPDAPGGVDVAFMMHGGAIDVVCPQCGALAGELCRYAWGEMMRDPHYARSVAARRAAYERRVPQFYLGVSPMTGNPAVFDRVSGKYAGLGGREAVRMALRMLMALTHDTRPVSDFIWTDENGNLS